MADEAVEVLLKRLERAKKARAPWESLYEECYRYALPSKNGFFGTST